MDKKIYETMASLLEKNKTEFTKDIRFIGTIETIESGKTGDVTTLHDIFVMIDDMPDGSTVEKFFNENEDFIAGRNKNVDEHSDNPLNKDGKLFPAAELAYEDLSFLGQIEELTQEKGISLDELDYELEQIAQELGLSKEEILAMSEIDLEQRIGENAKEDPQLTLDDDDQEVSEEQTKQNKNALENIKGKQEINLDAKVDTKNTLGQILGVPEGSKLIAVYSDAIKGNTNSTRFSFIIKNPDGTLSPADMLEQTGGKESDKNIYETNRDGSEVEKKRVNSSYKINSPLVENGLLTARIGSMGYIEVDYGQIDKTHNKDAFTQELETTHTRYTTREVREEFGRQQGTDNIRDNLKEARDYIENGNRPLTLDEVDGDPSTGNVNDKILSEIKNYDSNISDVFTDNEIVERFKKVRALNPDFDIEDAIRNTGEELSTDAENMRGARSH